MTAPEDMALELVNRQLVICARVTVTGDQLKCAVSDDEGGWTKTYLDAADCRALADAFAVLSASLGLRRTA